MQGFFKAAEEHVVGLIDDDVAHLAQRDRAALVQQQQPRGRRHHQVRAVLELEDRLAKRRTALRRAYTQPDVLRERLGDRADLRRELARRCEHERARPRLGALAGLPPQRWRTQLLLAQRLHRRQQIRERFAAACARRERDTFAG